MFDSMFKSDKASWIIEIVLHTYLLAIDKVSMVFFIEILFYSCSNHEVSFNTREIYLFVGSPIKTKKIPKIGKLKSFLISICWNSEHNLCFHHKILVVLLFDGYLTSLVLWNQSLSDQQSRETYRFYESHLTKSNLEAPLLIAPYMMKFLTGLYLPEFNHCFKKEMSLKDFTELSCKYQFTVIEEDDYIGILEIQPVDEYSPFYF